VADEKLGGQQVLSGDRARIRGSEPYVGVKVEDVMSRPVVAVNVVSDTAKVARLMRRRKVGSVIVVDQKGNPVGIITERDLAKRIVAKNLLASHVKAKGIMSTPLVTIDPKLDIFDAASKMKQFRIRRLVVVEKGEAVGVLSSKDIVNVTPALIEVIVQKSRIGKAHHYKGPDELSGYCDECESWSERLESYEGMFLCENCMGIKRWNTAK
jgi:signal-transduction protein with cAMP-binding, CBS, and nucleotidyltransferase domain